MTDRMKSQTWEDYQWNNMSSYPEFATQNQVVMENGDTGEDLTFYLSHDLEITRKWVVRPGHTLRICTNGNNIIFKMGQDEEGNIIQGCIAEAVDVNGKVEGGNVIICNCRPSSDAVSEISCDGPITSAGKAKPLLIPNYFGEKIRLGNWEVSEKYYSTSLIHTDNTYSWW